MASAPPGPAGLPEALSGLGRTLVMGVLNVTPDSFSDGGLFLEAEDAVRRGLALAASGADLVDVGGESTRPGAGRVPVEEELHRVLPVVAALAERGVHISIDTTRAVVAEQALQAGAVMVNDVSGGLGDPDMLPFVATTSRPYVAMHWRGPSTVMAGLAVYDDVVRDVRHELRERLEAARLAGVDPAYVILDPGLGFAKEGAHNWSLLARLDELAGLGRPILVGASRKRFLGSLLGSPTADGGPPDPRPMLERDDATVAVSALAAAAGAWCVRVHEPRGSLDAVLVASAWRDRGGRA